MAAALAAGPGAVLSHRSAASLWGLIRSVPAVADVTTRGRHRSRVGISLHRARLPPDEVTTADGIPATTPHRTLFDLAVVVDRLALERAIEQADARSLTDTLSLGALLERHPRRPGAATLRAILDGALATSAPTRSELEDRFLALLAAHGCHARRSILESRRVGGGSNATSCGDRNASSSSSTVALRTARPPRSSVTELATERFRRQDGA